jgi:hypothetical protein
LALFKTYLTYGPEPSKPHLGHSFLALHIIIQLSHFYNVLKPTQEEIAEALGMKHSWVRKWDPVEHWSWNNKCYGVTFFGYNVWGFKDESWRRLFMSTLGAFQLEWLATVLVFAYGTFLTWTLTHLFALSPFL